MTDDDDDLDLGRLLSAKEAQQELGIPASTVATWFWRRTTTGLYEGGRDNRRRPSFWECDLLALAQRIPVRDELGRRIITMSDVQAPRS